MQLVQKAHEVVPTKKVRDFVPARLIRLVIRLASLPEGQHVLLLTVGDDYVDWRVSPLGDKER